MLHHFHSSLDRTEVQSAELHVSKIFCWTINSSMTWEIRIIRIIRIKMIKWSACQKMSEILERRTCLAPGTRLNAQIRRSVSSQVSNCAGTGIGDSYHKHGEPKQQTAKHKAQLAMGKDSNCRCSRKKSGSLSSPLPRSCVRSSSFKTRKCPTPPYANSDSFSFSHIHAKDDYKTKTAETRVSPVSKNEKFLLKITSPTYQ